MPSPLRAGSQSPPYPYGVQAPGVIEYWQWGQCGPDKENNEGAERCPHCGANDVPF